MVEETASAWPYFPKQSITMVISKTIFSTAKASISGITANIFLEFGKAEGRWKVLGKEKPNTSAKSKTIVATESAPVFTLRAESTKESGFRGVTKALG